MNYHLLFITALLLALVVAAGCVGISQEQVAAYIRAKATEAAIQQTIIMVRATATAQAAATATALAPAPTPQPTPTPTAPAVPPTIEAAACQELVVNGGFEAKEGWTFARTSRSAGYTGSVTYQGARAARLGVVPPKPDRRSHSSAYQRVHLPAEADLTLTFRYQPHSENCSGDYQETMLLTNRYGRLRTLMRVRENEDQWLERSFDVTRYAGREVVLYFSVFNNGDGCRTWMYLDQVSLLACPKGVEEVPVAPLTATPSPTPTATSTSTPTPSATPTTSPGVTATPVSPTWTATAVVSAPSPTVVATATSTPSELVKAGTPTPTSEVSIHVPGSGRVNVRTGPGLKFGIMTTIGRGRDYPVIGANETRTWWRICCVNDRPGWVSAAVVAERGDTSNVPIVGPVLPDDLYVKWQIRWECHSAGCKADRCQGESVAKAKRRVDERWLEVERQVTWEDEACGQPAQWITLVDIYGSEEKAEPGTKPVYRTWEGVYPGPANESVKIAGQDTPVWCTEPRTKEQDMGDGWVVVYEGRACYDIPTGMMLGLHYIKKWLFTGTFHGRQYEREYFGDYELYQEAIAETNVPVGRSEQSATSE